MNSLRSIVFLIVFLFFWSLGAQGQSFKGVIYRSDSLFKLGQTLVINKKTGEGVISSNDGSFQVKAAVGDLFIISRTGFYTDTIIINQNHLMAFNKIFLKEKPVLLREFKIIEYKPKLIDPIERRKEYSYILDRPRPTVMSPISLIYDQFSKHGREMRKFEEYFYKYEKERQINMRYNPDVVKLATGLTGKELEIFMKFCRPDYSYVISASDYEFIRNIQLCYLNYKMMKKEETNPTPPPMNNPDLKGLPIDSIR